jgi:hypothetical protein
MSDYPTPPPSGGEYPTGAGGQYPPGGGYPTQPGQGGAMPPYPSGGQQMAGMSDNGGGGFFAALFDFSFSRFVTPMIVKLVYVLATIALGLLYIVFVISAFYQSVGAGIGVLFLGAVVALIYLAFIRMTLEFYYAIVRMSQDINRRLPGA